MADTNPDHIVMVELSVRIGLHTPRIIFQAGGPQGHTPTDTELFALALRHCREFEAELARDDAEDRWRASRSIGNGKSPAAKEQA